MFKEFIAAGASLVSGIGAGAVVKTILKKVITQEESQQVLIKIGTYAITGVITTAAGKYAYDTVEQVFGYGESIKDMLWEMQNRKTVEVAEVIEVEVEV